MKEDFSTYSLYQLSESVRVRKAPHSYGRDLNLKNIKSGLRKSNNQKHKKAVKNIVFYRFFQILYFLFCAIYSVGVRPVFSLNVRQKWY